MTTTQMNTRINRELKAAGDRALKEAGLTPSQAVRWLWGYFASHSEDQSALQCFHADPSIASLSISQQARHADGEISATHEVVDSIQNFRSSMGLEGMYQDPLSDDELLESALYEHLQERGLV